MISLRWFTDHSNIERRGLSFLSENSVQLVTDNRVANSLSLFIAIVGERYNPLRNLDKLEDSGCRFVVLEHSEDSLDLISKYNDRFTFFICEDITSLIAEMGEEVARDFRDKGGNIIAISGSNGKTTTKEMMTYAAQSILGQDEVIATQKNNNNHLGVPFTLFQITSKTKLAIVELGSNAPGEIEFLCRILKPQYGVTTNIGETHLEFFDTKENVFKEEAILYRYCTSIFFQNEDDDFLKTLEKEKHFLSYGLHSRDFQLRTDYNKAILNKESISNSFLTGSHNFINLGVAAIVLGEVYPDKKREVLDSLTTFRPTRNRSEWVELYNSKVYLDAYNANPASMKASIVGFIEYLDQNNITLDEVCLILGDMNELGRNAKKLHQSIGKFVESLSVGHFIAVGDFSHDYLEGHVGSSASYQSSRELQKEMKILCARYRYLFVKGSRSLQLERIIDIKEC